MERNEINLQAQYPPLLLMALRWYSYIKEFATSEEANSFLKENHLRL